MHEELLEPGAEIVLARLAVLAEYEAVFGAAAIAPVAYLATLALPGQRVALVLAELALLGRGDHGEHVGLVDVAQQVLWFDEVIARVQVTVVLQRRAVAAGGRVDTQHVAAEEGLERDIEQLHIDLTHVTSHPFLEHIDQEAAVLFGAHRPFGDQVAGLGIEQALLAGHFAPALVGNADGLLGGALDDGDELDPLRAQFVAKEAVDRPPMVLVGGIDGTQDVEVDLVTAQRLPALHHQIEGALAATVQPVGVVQLARAIHTQADQKVVLLEEAAPVVVQQQAVGLEGVLDRLPGPAVLLDQLDRMLKEFEFHQRRLAALPGHRDFGHAVRFEQLADVGLERGRRHPALVVRVERFLGQEEAVGAIDIAGRAAGLGQQMETGRTPVGHRQVYCGRFSGLDHCRVSLKQNFFST